MFGAVYKMQAAAKTAMTRPTMALLPWGPALSFLADSVGAAAPAADSTADPPVVATAVGLVTDEGIHV